MVAEAEKTIAPYAPVQHILNIIRRFRARGLPDPLTLQELERVGVPPSNAPRTLAALRFLGLIDDEGRRTEALEHIGRASTAEYAEVLAEVVRAAYAPVFTVIDPAVDDETAIHDAFRHYMPRTQRHRMVTVFLGLCREAGIVPGGPVQRRPRRRREPAEWGAPPVRQVVRPEAAVSAEAVGQPTVTHADGAVDYRLISALMQQLPKDGIWTRARRDKWVQAVSAAIDLLTDIVEEEENSG